MQGSFFSTDVVMPPPSCQVTLRAQHRLLQANKACQEQDPTRQCEPYGKPAQSAHLAIASQQKSTIRVLLFICCCQRTVCLAGAGSAQGLPCKRLFYELEAGNQI
jgi:hypothetical protein